MNIHPTHFYPEDGDRMYLWNVDNTAHTQAIQRPKGRNANKNNYIIVN
jgi:hypothetical protein